MSLSIPQPSDPTLDSIISIPDGVENWMMVSNNHAMARLHALFWGKAMDQDSNGSSSKGEEYNEQLEDDVVPGCPAFELEETGKVRNFLIRAEYKRVYDFLVQYYEETRSQIVAGPPAAVVTGQPGIGKSIWLHYALRKCLTERTPVIWHHQNKPYIFVDEGVYRMKDNFLQMEYKTMIWTLIDSDNSPSGSIPGEFIFHQTPFFLVFTTSPTEERWSRLHKTVSVRVIVMNPWTRSEIRQASQLLNLTTKTETETIDGAYDELGPTPRICLDMAFKDWMLDDYKRKLESKLNELTLQDLQDIADGISESLTMDSLSHKLCLVKRMDPHNVGSDFELTHITDHIRSRIVIRLRNLDTLEQINFYRKISRPHCRTLAGHVFEAFCQKQFQKKIEIEYIPMVRLDDNQPKDDTQRQQRNPQWHSSHNPFADAGLAAEQAIACNHRATLDIRPSATLEYDDRNFEGFDPTPDVYYVPSRQNAVAVDSFIFHNNRLFLFQFTVSNQHGISPKLITTLTKCTRFKERAIWVFIFVMPDDVEVLTCPYPREHDLQEVKPHLSKIKLDTYLAESIGEGEQKEHLPKKQKRAKAPVEELVVDNDGEGSKHRQR